MLSVIKHNDVFYSHLFTDFAVLSEHVAFGFSALYISFCSTQTCCIPNNGNNLNKLKEIGEGMLCKKWPVCRYEPCTFWFSFITFSFGHQAH